MVVVCCCCLYLVVVVIVVVVVVVVVGCCWLLFNDFLIFLYVQYCSMMFRVFGCSEGQTLGQLRKISENYCKTASEAPPCAAASHPKIC